jgi:hypothetical protein
MSPLKGFGSRKVNLSTNAFPFGTPDGPAALLALAANLPLGALSDGNEAGPQGP